MSKTFTYERITECGYLSSSDEYEYYGDEFEYEVSGHEISEAIADIIADDYFGGNKKAVRNFISDFDLYDILEEALEEQLKDYFEEEALSNY